ncbi:MAG: energy transducer TonB [Verrucomicrobia bacterium]|nr:energy transducer TonB [Verrucomicrobiota bacterium]
MIRDSNQWRLGRWAASIGLVCAIQIGLLWSLSDPALVAVRRPRPGPDLVLIAGTAADAELHRSARFGDPTLYALADQRGFSGPVWWEFPRPRPHLAEWREADSWLAPQLDRWGTDFRQLARSNSAPALPIMDQPAVRLNSIPVAPGLLASESSLQIEGPLRGRKLLTPLELPTWPATEWLTNTIVRVAVSGAGKPVSVVLEERSGAREADQRALELAWQARFGPLPGSALPPPLELAPRTWGRLVFQWRVREPERASKTQPR